MELGAVMMMTGASLYACSINSQPIPISIPKMSDYNKFVKERFKEIKESSPNISKTEIFKIIAVEWKMKKENF